MEMRTDEQIMFDKFVSGVEFKSKKSFTKNDFLLAILSDTIEYFIKSTENGAKIIHTLPHADLMQRLGEYWLSDCETTLRLTGVGVMSHSLIPIPTDSNVKEMLLREVRQLIY